jgi:hypothetical protein
MIQYGTSISPEKQNLEFIKLVRPVLAYAAEARPDTAYSMKALETAEITMLRKITRNRMNDNPQ